MLRVLHPANYLPFLVVLLLLRLFAPRVPFVFIRRHYSSYKGGYAGGCILKLKLRAVDHALCMAGVLFAFSSFLPPSFRIAFSRFLHFSELFFSLRHFGFLLMFFVCMRVHGNHHHAPLISLSHATYLKFLNSSLLVCFIGEFFS